MQAVIATATLDSADQSMARDCLVDAVPLLSHPDHQRGKTSKSIDFLLWVSGAPQQSVSLLITQNYHFTEDWS